jgi:putative membrane protein
MWQLFLALLAGIAAGTITGIIPGIHINLVAATLLLMTPFLETNSAIVFIAALAITHTFLNFIPAVFLGAPDEGSALSVLPGHKLLLEGRGHYAVKLTIVGSIIAIFSLIVITPIFLLLVPKIYPFIERMMAFFLIWISGLLVFHKKSTMVMSAMIFLLAGLLGITSTNLNLSQPLLPLLTGLFGSSAIIISLKSKTKIPTQIIKKEKIPKKDLIKPAITTILISPLCSFFPGLGSSQAAVISSMVSKLKQSQFLILLGSINTIVISISFVTLFLIQKSRSGAAAAISQLTNISTSNLKLIFITIFITAIIAAPLAMLLSKVFAKAITKINYNKISIIILIFLTILIFFFSGTLGILLFIVSTLLGITCIELGVQRNLLMGTLLIPTIIFYLPI